MIILFTLLVALVLATACSDVRPVAKIGLIAPFEGLHRRAGYEALAAMRLAIADSPVTPLAFIPLALDDSADPERTRRAAQKLRADPQVKAIVGPLSPVLADSVGDLSGDRELPWFAPFAVAQPGGFVNPLDSPAWAGGLIEAVGAAVQQQGAGTLFLAGEARGWPDWNEAEWSAAAGLPVRFLDDDPAAVATLTAGDALFWLGAAEDAADFHNRYSSELAKLPFWLGPAGGDPVLSEHLKTDSKLYWSVWSNFLYTEWAVHHTPSTPSAFLIYQATRRAVDVVTGAATGAMGAEVTPWHVELFEIEDGVSRSFTP
jgi:branched-chain amino acid transport system substrate-binding protein